VVRDGRSSANDVSGSMAVAGPDRRTIVGTPAWPVMP